MAVSRVKTSSVLQGFPKYRSMLGGNAAFIPTSFESIATVTVNSGTGSVTFSSIPGTYKHLQLRYNLVASSSSNGYIVGRFNGDTNANNWASHTLLGNGSTASSASDIGSSSGNNNFFVTAVQSGQSLISTFPMVGIIDIHDYASTTKNKTVRTLAGMDNNSTGGKVNLNSSLWQNTAAITSIFLLCDVPYSSGQWSLYGIN